ncbi:MAG: YHS domain-containing protein [Kiritimatiellaeota bacterium]|nr:YHS domain-containing protein [Kiritimatiellota bacterium]
MAAGSGSKTKASAAARQDCPKCGQEKCTAACKAKAGKACAPAADKKSCTLRKGKAQAACPVMGGKIDKQFYADYQGKRVYFCCADCIAAFKKDPTRYLRKLQKQGVSLAAASQTTCPVMGGKIDKKYYADYQGKRVYFCCGSCIAAFKKAPAKFLKKLDDQGVAPAVVCPKCGKIKGTSGCCVKPAAKPVPVR